MQKTTHITNLKLYITFEHELMKSNLKIMILWTMNRKFSSAIFIKKYHLTLLGYIFTKIVTKPF